MNGRGLAPPTATLGQPQGETLLLHSSHAHLYPARMFMSVDFPAPEGPMMATSSPLLNFPEIPFRRVLYPAESTS